jgi:hypothetical protein
MGIIQIARSSTWSLFSPCSGARRQLIKIASRNPVAIKIPYQRIDTPKIVNAIGSGAVIILPPDCFPVKTAFYMIAQDLMIENVKNVFLAVHP